MITAKLDPSAVIGGKLPMMGSSGRVGKSENFVCEACEFVDTFLDLSPDVAVILNIDEDHLDYFKTLDNLIKSFHKFASMATKAVIYNGDDANTLKAMEAFPARILLPSVWLKKMIIIPKISLPYTALIMNLTLCTRVNFSAT